MKEQWFVAIPAGRWQIYGIKKAQELGFKVVGIDGNAESEAASICDKFLHADINDVEAVCEQLDRNNLNIVGVASLCSEAGVLAASQIREVFSLPGPLPAVAARLLYKGVMRESWRKAGICRPKFAVVESMADLTRQQSNLEFPIVIKPVDGAGSRGVSKCRQAEEVPAKFDLAMSASRLKSCIAEEFLSGQEHTAEVFLMGGKLEIYALTTKVKIEETGGVVAHEITTAQVTSERLEEIRRFLENAFVSLGYLDGPGHAEIMIDGSDTALIEVGGRGAGFYLSDRFVGLVSGVDYPGLVIRQLTSNLKTLPAPKRKFGILKFFPSSRGVVRKVSGFDSLVGIPNVEGGSFVRVGERVQDPTSDADRLGYLICYGEDENEVRDHMAEAVNKINFEIS